MTNKKMFSDYSWWDFIKVALALIIPYYAFVIVKYYREDIREWLANRGQKGDKQLATETPTQSVDQLTKDLFAVQSYPPLSTTVEPVNAQTTSAVETPAVATPPAQTTPPTGQTTPAVADRPAITNEPAIASADEEDEQEPEGLLGDGPAVVDNAPVVIQFEGTLHIPSESSLSELIDAGQHLQKQPDGLITAPEHDVAGNELAEHINRQNNKIPALAGISFNRR